MRYIKITGESVTAKEKITKQDLFDVARNFCDYLIDTKYGTYFNAKKNEWIPITVIG